MWVRRVVVVLLSALAVWLAWRPAKEHPDSPIRIRGIFRFVNFLGKAFYRVFGRPLLPLNPHLFEAKLQAIKQAEQELYGSPNTPSEFNGLSGLFAGFESPGALLSTLGRVRMLRTIRRGLNHRQQILTYVKNHPEVVQVPVERPLIITGLPRSGTTFLQRLMSTDPHTRSLPVWVMMSDPNPVPPTKEQIENLSDPRLEKVQKTYGIGGVISPDKEIIRRMSHAVQPTDIDEESNLMGDCLWHNTGATVAGEDDSYKRWILDDSQDKTYMYRYVKVWLQIQSSVYAPDSHWLLKTPAHAFFLSTLEKEFPDANLVFIHRNPCSVIPSACRLNQLTAVLTMDSAKFNPQWHGETILAALGAAAQRIVDFAHSRSDLAQRAFHVRYEELTADPMGTVEQIYTHFGYQMTPEFRENMRQHLEENRQHKFGKPDYSLEGFGLTEAKVNETFAAYNQAFRQRVEA